MGIYNFKSRFVPFILTGLKTHTIRAHREYPDKPGNTLHLYTGLRQPGAKLLMRAKCIKVEEISIAMRSTSNPLVPALFVQVDHELLDGDEREALARRDGFRDFGDMMQFWQGRLPFFGQIIHWEPPKTVPKGSLAKWKRDIENKWLAEGKI